MRWMIATGIRFGRLLVVAAIAMTGFAVLQLRSAAVDVYPEFAATTVEVQAEALGLSAAEVEQLITVPIEQDLLNGVPWVQRITSRSIPGLSSIQLVFEPGTDLYQARQVVQERMTQAHALPGVGTPPVMVEPRSSVNRVSMIGLSSTKVSPIEMSVLARWQIRPRLLGIPGVANVSIWGQRDRQLQVQVDPARLKANDVTLTQLIETTGNALWVSPLSFVEASTPGTGGFVETPNQRLSVQHVSPITTADALAGVAVAGGSTRIGDVADVVEDHQPLIGDASVNGAENILLVIDKLPEADTAQVTADVEAALAALSPGLSGITVDTDAFRPESFIRSALGNLGWVALLGLAAMALLIGGLLRSWRAAAVALVAVPVSVVGGLYVLHGLGTPFTALTVVGLVAAAGVLVDGVIAAVVGVRARVARESAAGQPPGAGAVFDALSSGRVGLAYASVVALVAAAPLLVLSGIAGQFARGAVITYAVGVAAAALVALLLVPALAVALLTGEGTRLTPIERAGAAVYGPRMFAAISRPVTGLAVVAVLALLALAAVPQLRSDAARLPELNDRNLLVRLDAVAGTSLAEMRRISGVIATEVGRLDVVDAVAAHAGRALTSDQVVDVNSAEMWVRLDASVDVAAAADRVRAVVAGYPGLRSRVGDYADERLAAATDTREGDLVVRVYGSQFDQLRSTAESVADTLGTVRGVVSPRVEAQPVQPTVRIEVDLARAGALGLKPGDVRREAATLISGLLVGNLYEEQKVFDVVVWGGPAVRHSPSGLADLLIDTPSGGQVRLGDIATVGIGPEQVAIPRDAVSRSLDVIASIPSRDRADVAAEVTQRLRALQMPLEYRAEVVGDSITGPNLARVGWYALAAAIAVLLLFQALSRSWRAAIVLTGTVPLAVVGGIVVAPLVGGVRSVGVLAGLVCVVTVAGRHGVLLFERARTIEAETAKPPADAVLQAARERAPAVLLGSAALAGLLLPAALVSRDGLEFLHPAAITVLAALVSSALVTLVALPALYAAFVPAGTADDLPPDLAVTGPQNGAIVLPAGSAEARQPVMTRTRSVVRRSAMLPRRFAVLLPRRFAVLLAVPAFALAGCAGTEESSAPDPAGVLQEVPGSDIPRVVLTDTGAKRLGVQTAAVQGTGAGLTVPYASVVYDADGKSWVYTNPSGTSYLRKPITIKAIQGDQVQLTAGPAAGVPVVIVGAIELVGVEAGLGER